jgi:hypothetical protein
MKTLWAGSSAGVPVVLAKLYICSVTQVVQNPGIKKKKKKKKKEEVIR